MRRLTFIGLSTAVLCFGQFFLLSPAHAIWRSIAITQSTVTLMQILSWNPHQVERWEIKPNPFAPIINHDIAGVPASLTPEIQRKIVLIVGAIESRLNYGIINNRVRGGGIAYGYLQVLSRHGGLQQLLSLYSTLQGTYSQEINSLGSSTSERVVRRARFQELLGLAGDDPIMQRAQTLYFSREYFLPMIKFGHSLGLKDPTTYLILFDTFIHYGNSPWLQDKLTKLFKEYGETKGMIHLLVWMRSNLEVRYNRTYGKGSLQARYNQWRVWFLWKLWRLRHKKLHGEIRVHAPQWRDPILVR